MATDRPIVSQATIDEVRALSRDRWESEQRSEQRRTEKRLREALATARFHVEHQRDVPWQAVQILIEEATVAIEDEYGKGY